VALQKPRKRLGENIFRLCRIGIFKVFMALISEIEVAYPFWLNILRDKQYETSETNASPCPYRCPWQGRADPRRRLGKGRAELI
jgi:hypothetical protein